MESYPATNGSVPGVGVGVFPADHLPLSVPIFTATACSSAYLDDSNSNNSLSEIFLDQYTEVDVSSEWLSSFVEECLSSAGNCHPPLPKLEQTTTLTTSPTAPSNDNNTSCPNPPSNSFNHLRITQKKIHQNFTVPGKPRSQRKRRRATTNTSRDRNPLFRWAECLNPETQSLQLGFSDPPLLEQAYWLADSELITLPRNDGRMDFKTQEQGDGKKLVINKKKGEMKVEYEEEEFGKENNELQQQQQARRCSHCQAQKTPQWRAGPLGPKTLCNACGVRYFKSGRLLPEYRPAKSPTFLSDKHSNSHKKVLQMRKAHL